MLFLSSLYTDVPESMVLWLHRHGTISNMWRNPVLLHSLNHCLHWEFLVCPGFSAQLDMSSGGILTRSPDHLNGLLWTQKGSYLSLRCIPSPQYISKGEPGLTPKETHSSRFIWFFQSLTRAVGRRWKLERDTGKLLPLHHDTALHHPTSRMKRVCNSIWA